MSLESLQQSLQFFFVYITVEYLFMAVYNILQTVFLWESVKIIIFILFTKKNDLKFKI